ncbi:HAD-IIIC family phosphatase [Dactylosporangium sp. CA-233914]|uniref:HAD-IIIC family phosphatase n=1 Tax=Dactylosporangium sp. CA-233914 TaxID=3239934 RepID=UPI003D933CAF
MNNAFTMSFSHDRTTTARPGPAGGDDPHADFFTVLRTGDPVADYPRVRALLRSVPHGELPRAGRLLSRLDADEVLRHHPAQPVLNVAVTGHGTLSELLPPLTAELARHGLLLRPYTASFDTYLPELLDPDSELYRSRPDIVLCVLDPHIVLDELPTPWTVADAERVLAEKVGLIDRLTERFETAPGRLLVLNTLPLPPDLPALLTSDRHRAELGAVWREANARLLRMGTRRSSVVVVDLDPLIAGGTPVCDRQMSQYVKAHLGAGLLGRYAREVGHLARQLAGQTRKCLVVDLDGTMWGGILGDDGAEGIEIGPGPRGEAFAAFQRAVAQLKSQGILLAVVSKNDAEPVRRVLGEHPGMVLRDEDFVRVIANWEPKHDNIESLARALNLATGSFVFVDDSPYECALVRRALPEVEVIEVGPEPALHLEKLLADRWFGVRELTAEDLGRTEQYRVELRREEFAGTFTDIGQYLRELGITVRFAAVAEAEVPRVAQLTQRTNQFNMGLRRLEAAEVRDLAGRPDHSVLTIRSADRFADNGLVGAVLCRRADGVTHIDNFLLSCRVFARGIENACLSALLRHEHANGARAVQAVYRYSPKNTRMKPFYATNGFIEVSDDGVEAVFRHDLVAIADPPGHLRLITDL